MIDLTIVIPTRGDSPHLERAIEAAKLAAEDVIVIDGIDAPGKARNEAIGLLSTEWVGFLDDDDILLPHTYREATDYWAGQGADVVVHTMIDENGNKIPRPGATYLIQGDRGVPLPTIWHGNVGISFAMKSELWRQNPFIAGPPYTMRGEDYELLRRLMDQDRFVVVSDAVAYIVKPEAQP